MSPAGGRLRATDLHDLALCPHRVHLERRLGPEARDAPSALRARLMRRGLDFEKQVAATVGWPRPEYPPGDFEAGARATEALMRAGVPGIYQGVLLDERRLAIPDLLERAAGESRLGEHSYLPGDIKAGREPGAHQALQVGLSALLLEALQGRLPERGFLSMGDGRRVELPIDRLAPATRRAEERARRIIDGLETTRPFLCPACGGCPWRSGCLSEMTARGDLSLIEGMTPARRRRLEERGIVSIEDLAGLTPAAEDADPPPLNLEQLVPQARALVEGRIAQERPLEVPPAAGGLLVEAPLDPLAGGVAQTLAWRVRDEAAGSGRVRWLGDARGLREAARDFERAAERAGGWLFHFGGAVPRTLARLGEEGGLAPTQLEALTHRLWDLRSSLRRAAAWLPVWRYQREQVLAAIDGRDLPWPGEDSELPLLVEALGHSGDATLRGEIEAHCRRALDQLAHLLEWVLSRPHRLPRRPA